MSALKILMLGWEYAPVISGGLGVVCKSLSESLVNKGLDVTFVIPKLPENVKIAQVNLVNAEEVDTSYLPGKLRINEITSTLMPYMDFEQYQAMYGGSRAYLRRKDWDNEIYGPNLLTEVENYALRTMYLAAGGDYDIIHAHDWMTFRAGIRIKSLLHIPLIVHVHSTELDRTGDHPNPLIFAYEKEGMKFADKIIALSDYLKNRIVQNYDIEPAKVVVIHNAIDKEISQDNQSNEQRIPADSGNQLGQEKMVLFLARLSIQKGADFLLQAAQKVLQVMPNVRFVFVGKGNMLEQLINLTIDLGISDRVTFAGPLSHDQVDKMYRHANLFVMPSVSEPFGLTSLEAIKNGAPVLISKQSGVSEVLKNCLKVDFWDIDEMANKILAVLGHESLQDTLVENGYHDLEKISWDKQADLVIEQYNAIKQ